MKRIDPNYVMSPPTHRKTRLEWLPGPGCALLLSILHRSRSIAGLDIVPPSASILSKQFKPLKFFVISFSPIR